MSEGLFEKIYNPDVLTCLANLSNDEVFTPPDIANKMLDMLPQDLFENPNTTFLDPACKSGVFLREVAKRLIKGLENKIPDLQERIDHIFHKQLFAIAITELTSLLSRRSLYCSKYANSDFSISNFENADGNIRFKKVDHTWNNGTCIFCGASQKQYDRDKNLESHAYEFIHTENVEDLFKMKFDVIIGNPPYQLSTGGGQAQATPLYDKFVSTAIRLNPSYVSMIVPARWYGGGFPCIKKLRENLTKDNHVRYLHDYPDATDCFCGVEIKGGVCYFLWEKNYNGPCYFYNHGGNNLVSKKIRYLIEKKCETVIRDNEAISILEKVQKLNEKSFSTMVGALWPFNTKSTFSTFSKEKKKKDDIFAYVLRNTGWVNSSEIDRNRNLINAYKILLPRSVGEADVSKDVLKPIIAKQNSCCSGTYLICGPFSNEMETENVVSYINTKFFHYLLSLKKFSQDTVRSCYDFIPMQNFSEEWSDEKLFNKYNLTKGEQEYILKRVWG